MPRTARRARSSGFDGTIEEYIELYDVSCQAVDDCAAACLARGGTEEMCGASECLPVSAGSQCLPAPVWTNLESIQFEDASTVDSIQLVLVSGSYHDLLLADELGLEVPDGATITGITVEIRKAGDEMVVDDSVRIIKGGELGTAERASSARWPDELTWLSYGGPEDLWGTTWTPADVNAADFGVALSTLYTQTVGNTRAYVDQVRATIHYQTACE
jgi:hypothetical protein